MHAPTETLALAGTIFRRFRREITQHNYSEILALEALARMGTHGSPQFLEQAKNECTPFLNGAVTELTGAFMLYRCGGNGAAWLFKEGHLPGRDAVFAAHAESLMKEHPRSLTGLFNFPAKDGRDMIWIDAAWATVPFLLYTGLKLGRNDLIDEAVRQALLSRGVLLDGVNGLFHQAVGFSGSGVRSQDHWSRGNGWAAVAICELACDIPEQHAYRSTLHEVYRNFIDACLAVQDNNGMWHQEMTDHGSFVETSGSGLILYAIGRGIEKGLLPQTALEPFAKGIRAYLQYISADGAVDATCIGCCSPGDGSIAQYIKHSWKLNDPHAFGAAMLALSQAHIIGLRSIDGVPSGRDRE